MLAWLGLPVPLALLLVMMPIFELAELSLLVWPFVLLVDLLAAAANNAQVTARVDAQAGLAPGQAVRLHLDMRRVHIFEPGDAGKNLGA